MPPFMSWPFLGVLKDGTAAQGLGPRSVGLDGVLGLPLLAVDLGRLTSPQ